VSEDGDRQPKELIYEMRRQMQAARNRYWQQQVTGSISEQVHQELATRLVQYHDVLHEFRDHANDWPDISAVRERLGREVEVQTEGTGLGRGWQLERRPAITQIPAEQLVEMSKQLDDIACDLGFSAPVTEGPDKDVISQEVVKSTLDDNESDKPEISS